MGKKASLRTAKAPKAGGAALGAPDGGVPVVGAREPCPCGSGRRYKACHGRTANAPEQVVARPFEGLPGECDWVALREIVPSATAPLRLADAEAQGERAITLATVLPMAWPALTRGDGDILLALQVPGTPADPSREMAVALQAALAADAGTPVAAAESDPQSPRLQDLLDTSAPLDVTVYDGFDFWLDGAEVTPQVQESMERANAAVIPTRRLESVEAAYWCRMRDRNHLRWVQPYDEEPMLDALARLRAAGADTLGEGTRFVGSFRALGLLVPVWDLPSELEAGAVEEPAAAYAERLADALADTTPLTPEQRRARAGLQTRQITLR
jgi:hypothetical protein